MNLNDIQEVGNNILITIPVSKTNKPRSFIVNEAYIEIYRRYKALRPTDFDNPRFFFKLKNGRGNRQVVGIHQFGKLPQTVATYLKLPNAKEYTGHCFRRSSATILVDTGADLTCLKRHGGWKSSTVAEGYIDDSLNNKIEVANRIFNSTEQNPGVDPNMTEINDNSESVAITNLNCNPSVPIFNTCTNCTINVNITNNK